MVYALPFGCTRRKWLLLGISCAVVGVLGAWQISLSAETIKEQGFSPKIEKIDLQPIRGDFKPLRLRRSGFEYKCSECHRQFFSTEFHKRLVAEHTNIVLNHGRNDFCLNCHHQTNRDAYVSYNGSEIPSDQPAELCAKCHGLIYRDWKTGAHGKLTGSWNNGKESPSRLLCIQCHDPHAPKFPALKPMPGPASGHPQIGKGETHG